MKPIVTGERHQILITHVQIPKYQVVLPTISPNMSTMEQYYWHLHNRWRGVGGGLSYFEVQCAASRHRKFHHILLIIQTYKVTPGVYWGGSNKCGSRRTGSVVRMIGWILTYLRWGYSSIRRAPYIAMIAEFPSLPVYFSWVVFL